MSGEIDAVLAENDRLRTDLLVEDGYEVPTDLDSMMEIVFGGEHQPGRAAYDSWRDMAISIEADESWCRVWSATGGLAAALASARDAVNQLSVALHSGQRASWIVIDESRGI